MCEYDAWRRQETEDNVPKGGATNAVDSTDLVKEEELVFLTNKCTVLLYHLSTSFCNNHDQLQAWFTGSYSTVDRQTFSVFCTPWDDFNCSLLFDLY